MSGAQVPVVSTELHATHLSVHLPALDQLLEQLNMGRSDPVQALAILQAFYQHISETAQFLAGDPSQEALVKKTKQSLNFAEEMIYNTSKQVEKMQREQMEAQPVQEGQPQVDPALEAKMRESEIKNQITMEKAKLDMEIKQAKFEQDQAIKDAENAMKLREQS